jgi:putative membrane-bound dehydrogenase-like protein
MRFASSCAFGFGVLLCLSACTDKKAKTTQVENSTIGGNISAAHLKVSEGYTVETVADSSLVDYPMFGTLDATGRLFLFESTGNVYEETKEALEKPQFRINLLQDTDSDGKYDKSTIFADKIGFPQGGVFYKGSLYVTSAPDLLKLTDADGDGVADKREVLLSGWVLNVNANSAIGPFLGPDGWLYLTSSIEGFDITTKEGQRLKGETARIWRLRPDGTKLEWISAGGMNNPVELTFTEAGEPIGTETYFTDPQAGQRDALVYWTEGGVYPKPNTNIDRDGLPRTGDLMPIVSKYSRVAPSGIARYRSRFFGDDFQHNLLSVQFNTHRVLRHKLIREGASFRTEDETFFSVDQEDFHPTDVLEDADGSILVVETGGWFIKGCPLSQVSKPEMQGALYRIRRKDADKVEDPYGNAIAWQSLSPAKAADYLSDARPFVQDRAAEHLAGLGEAAVKDLSTLLQQNASSDVRTKAVFTLYRIGTPAALTAMRTGLADKDTQVRVAAARAVGLARDTAAVPTLVKLLSHNDLPTRRQAATALGQIGHPQVVPALVAATDKASDRFVRHALIYSLITLNQPQPLVAALSQASAKTREAALIALDQMKASTLRSSQVMPFLNGKDKELQRTALWVASHHPEWAGDMIAFLRQRLGATSLTADEQELFGNLLVAFGKNVPMQQFMAQQVMQTGTEKQLFLLSSMARFPDEKLPANWINQISQLLTGNADAQVKEKALELVRLRNITSLAIPLQQVANDAKNTASLRMEAIAALTKTQHSFSPSQFDYLYSQLSATNQAPLRQQAAAVLAQGKLTESQLLKLATEYLPQADAFTLPRLVPVFKGGNSEKIGVALANTLQQSKSLDSFNEDNLKAVFASYPAPVKPAVNGLLAKLHQTQAERLKRLQAMESRIATGDIERGRVLFYGKAICYTCHKVGSEGGDLGPDLTSIQRDRSAHDLLEAIVYPSVSFVREYETYHIKTKTDEYTGIIRQETPTLLVLGTAPQTSVRIPRKDIVSMTLGNTSLMPQGLDQLLTEQEMADLMTFLLGQEQDPEKDASLLR